MTPPADDFDRYWAEQLELQGPVAIFALAAGLSAAIPIPVLDSILSGLGWGSAMRMVAARHQVRLTQEARTVLGAPRGHADEPDVNKRRVIGLLKRAAAPLRVVHRIENALVAFTGAFLFDHYLRTSDRREGAPLGEAEARRVRSAIDAASIDGFVLSLRKAPMGIVGIAVDAVKVAVTLDTEDRPPLERVMDHLLDAAVESHSDMSQALEKRFDRAFAESEHPMPEGLE